MNKAIKKEIKKQLREKHPPKEWETLISQYLNETEGTDKYIILCGQCMCGWGYWRTLRELNKNGFYMSQTVFYERLDEALGDLALRAAYERLISPYGEGEGAQ